MKTQHLLLAGALGVGALTAVGAVGYSYWAQSSEGSDAPAAATTIAPQSRQFSQQIDQFFQTGNYAAAADKARQWQTKHPGDADGDAAMGRVLAMQGDFDGAIRNGHAAIQANPRYDKIVKSWLDEALLIRKRYPNLQLFPMQPLQSPTEVARNQLESQAAVLLQTKNYDSIERTAADLLQSRATLPDDSWKLDAFALGLCIAPDGEAPWQANNARLREWQRARPKSALARLMLGRSWSDGAGRARGEDTSDKVSSSQQAMMNLCLAQAAPLLSDSIKDVTRTPIAYSGLQRWALRGQIPRPLYEIMWKKATNAFPDYTEFYLNKATFLMPRWYGKQGEWEVFAQKSADKIGGARGDKLYARIVLDQSLYYGDDFFSSNAVSWPRTKRGINAILSDSQDKITVATQAQRLASIADDLDYERQLFRGPLAHAFAADDVSPKDLSSERIYAFTH